MARTRRQVTLQEQESGIPASPPQSLPTATRSTRAKRTTTRNATTASSAAPPPSTRGEPAVRGGRLGRAKRAGQSRAQPLATINHDTPESSATDVDAPEASDSSTQVEVAVQPSPTTRTVANDKEATENVEELDVEPPGETQFHSGVSAHPVQVENLTAHPVQVEDVTAQPVQGSTTPQEPHESATSLKFREILKASPQNPRSSPTPISPIIPASIVPLKPTLEISSESSTPSRASPVSPSPVSPSPFPEPVPRAPSPASESTIYYAPSIPERSHSLITIRMDYIQGSKDPARPSEPAAFVVPSELVAPLCRYIESRAEEGSNLRKLTTDHPIVKQIVQGDARFRPQLPSWQSQQSPSFKGSTMRDAFLRRAQRKRGFREMEEETATLMAENAKLKAAATRTPHSQMVQTTENEISQSTESPRKRTKTVPDPFTADGQLVLGRTKEIEVDEYGVAINPLDETDLRGNDTEAAKKAQLEEARRTSNVAESPYVAEEIPNTEGPALGGLLAESQDEVQPAPVPETPRARGWGLSSLLPSARSVTKFIPFSSRRAVPTQQQLPTPQQQPAQQQPAQQQPAQQQPAQSQQIAQTEPPMSEGSSQAQINSNVADSATGPGPSHRPHQSTSNQQRLLTKEQSEEERRIKRMRAQLRREADALEKQKKDLDIAKKDLAEQRKLAESAQTPGKKRKRMPSPDVIPLPANGGFGLVDEYFIVDSSSDEDIAPQETPTKEGPLKKARTSVPDSAIVGSPFRARPYTGTLFAHPDTVRSRQENSVFIESDKPDADPALDSTPPPGPTLTFRVPSPGSSDSDDDEDDEQEQINQPTQRASSPSVPETRSILRNSPLYTSQAQARAAANSSTPSKPMAPPPRPNPVHATLPATTTMTPSGALEKAREKALKHQPKQPSTLRESSRLSTSTVTSDLGDDDIVEEYDPTNPAIVTAPSKAPVFGQSISPVKPASGQQVSSLSVATGFQQPVTQAVSEQPHEQQAVLSTSTQQAEAIHDIAAAHADDVRSSGQQAVSAKGQNETERDADQSSVTMDQKIKADLDRYWKEHGDDYVLDDGYDEFQKKLIAEEQELMDGPNGLPYKKPHNVISEALDRIGADSLADRGIQTDIEDNWRPDDLERTQSNPANGMRVFFNRLVKNGDIERDTADRVLEMGVPPGIVEYLAGQGVTGPVAV